MMDDLQRKKNDRVLIEQTKNQWYLQFMQVKNLLCCFSI